MNIELKQILDSGKADFEEIANDIWDHPETRYKESYASSLQERFMEQHGFTVEKEIGGIATAFKAVSGSGKPVIGFLGEFDALPGLSQTADQPSYAPLSEGAPGHGCGHNLLGTGCMEAACTIATYLKRHHLPGTVIYFGCPAEESGAGKAFMVREGCFDGVDFALAWHPSPHNALMSRSLANVRIIFSFHGKSAHAAGAPQSGRSALDACELTNVGVQYLREHVISSARMHSAYLNAGGDAPNVIPAEASILYALRAPKQSQVKELIERVSDVARGAALMTGTRVDIKIVSAYADTVSVPAMNQLMLAEMHDVLPLDYTEEELAYARQFADPELLKEGAPVIDNTVTDDDSHDGGGSTDVGDVSWIVPTGGVSITTMANGTPGHSWCLTAQGKSSIAHKGMHAAALVLAEAAEKLFTDSELGAEIKADFVKVKGHEKYEKLLPDSAKPGDF